VEAITIDDGADSLKEDIEKGVFIQVSSLQSVSTKTS